MKTKIKFIPLDRISRPGGEIQKVYKSSDEPHIEIQDSYFSILEPNITRAWKLHKSMTVNAFVPYGMVKFVIVNSNDQVTFDENIVENPIFESIDIGPQSNYGRLIIPPKTWFGFQSGEQGGIVLNLADFIYDDDEVINLGEGTYDYSW